MRIPPLILLAAVTGFCGLSGCGDNKPTAPAAPAAPKKINAGGYVEALPVDGKFTIKGRKGTFKVDATGAKLLRDAKDITLKDLEPQAYVIATGTQEGETIKATRVTLIITKDQVQKEPTAIGGGTSGMR